MLRPDSPVRSLMMEKNDLPVINPMMRALPNCKQLERLHIRRPLPKDDNLDHTLVVNGVLALLEQPGGCKLKSVYVDEVSAKGSPPDLVERILKALKSGNCPDLKARDV